jgi:hypothetical protein
MRTQLGMFLLSMITLLVVYITLRTSGVAIETINLMLAPLSLMAILVFFGIPYWRQRTGRW